jgi:hypothetical protein
MSALEWKTAQEELSFRGVLDKRDELSHNNVHSSLSYIIILQP